MVCHKPCLILTVYATGSLTFDFTNLKLFSSNILEHQNVVIIYLTKNVKNKQTNQNPYHKWWPSFHKGCFNDKTSLGKTIRIKYIPLNWIEIYGEKMTTLP